MRRIRRMVRQDAAPVASWINHDLPVPPQFSRALIALIGRLIEEDCLIGACIDETGGGPHWRLAACGLSGFISDACAKALLGCPFAHFGLTLLDRSRNRTGEPGLLAYDQIAKANAGDGLNLYVLFWLQRSCDMSSPAARQLVMLGLQALVQLHTGYRLKLILKEAPAAQQQIFLKGGFERLRFMPAGSSMGFARLKSREDRILFGLSREDAEKAWPGSAVGALFSYSHPRCGFTHCEQQVLIGGTGGMTDKEIANELGITVNAVKQRWNSISDRVEQHAPFVLERNERGSAARGPERRRHIVRYVAGHPEELRPYDRS